MLGNAAREVSLRMSDTVEAFRSEVASAFEVQAADLRLFLGGRELKSGGLFDLYKGVAEGATVRAMVRKSVVAPTESGPPAEPSFSVRVTVMSSNASREVSVRKSDTVEAFRREVASVLEVQAAALRLLFGGRELKDGGLVGDYKGLAEGVTVLATVRKTAT